jgi:hypothetical protein
LIPISTFNLLVGIVIVLTIYAWVDHRNKLYGNIAAAILASLIGTLLAILIYIGAVQTDTGTHINDVPTAGILLLVSITIAAYSFFMVMEAKEEYENAQEQL